MNNYQIPANCNQSSSEYEKDNDIPCYSSSGCDAAANPSIDNPGYRKPESFNDTTDANFNGRIERIGDEIKSTSRNESDGDSCGSTDRSKTY